MMLIVGSYTSPHETGIHLLRYDQADKTFKPLSAVCGIVNPSFLTISHDNRSIYAVSEYKSGEFGKLSSYSLTAVTGVLTLTGQACYVGAGSAFISTDERDRHAFIANYEAGSLVVMSLSEKDARTVIQTIVFEGNGPDQERQTQSHIHSALLSPDERFLYCADLGSDRLYQFEYHPGEKEPLVPASPPFIRLPAGCGPRHMAFSPDKRWLYLITELSAEIFLFEAGKDLSVWRQQFSVLATGYKGKVEAADIQVHPNGKYLYASHRGDSNEIIVCFINPGNGHLSLSQRISSEGISPRNLLICEEESLLLAANEQSNSVSIFFIGDDGQLTFSGKHIHLKTPTCLKVTRH